MDIKLSESVEDFLRILVEPGSVFEIRSPKCPESANGRFKATASGYFRDAKKAAKAIKPYESVFPPAIYVTLNPCKPELLARAKDRIKYKAETTTSDDEIDRRRWLFIDIDPDRAADISSTDQELASATEVSDSIRAELIAEGWPEPLQGMSGNGRYLLWRIDLPNDKESSELIHSVLHSMANRFNSEGAEVDCSTFNASRICKLLGTVARKGDEVVGVEGVEDRPHRRSWFIEPDGPLEVVDASKLRSLAATDPKPAKAKVARQSPVGRKSKSTAYARAESYLETMDRAVSGEHGSDKLFRAAVAMVVGFGLDESQAFELLSGKYNQECQPPWSDQEIRHKIEDATKEPGERGWKLNEKQSEPSTVSETPIEPSESESDPSAKPEVVASLEYGSVCDQVVEHLGRLGWESPWIAEGKQDRLRVYQRGGMLVHIVSDDEVETTPNGIEIPAGAPRIRPLPSGQLSLRIADACQLVVEVEKDGETIRKPVAPAKWLIEGIHTRGDYGRDVRRLTGTITAPTMRSDGTILQDAGHDRQTGLLYLPCDSFPPIPDKPTRDEAKAAAAELLEVIRDFELQNDSDKSAWLAMVLTQIGRAAIKGCCPLFAISGTCRGSGKSLLADASSFIAYGRAASRKVFTDDTEMRKAITAIAVEALPSILIDNVDRTLGGASLDAALTATTWMDRLLKSSVTTGELPLRTVWTATGNNLQFGSDIARRVIPIRLVPTRENPEDRDGFAHPDLLGWVRSNRAKLAVAALTILRAYVVAGRPTQKGGQFGSFESWSALVRNAIVWIDEKNDPLATRETAKADDQSGAIVRGLIEGLQEIESLSDGKTAKQIIELIQADDWTNQPPRYQILREVVAEVATYKGRIDSRRLGNQMKKFRGRIAGDFQLIGEPAGGGVLKWSAKKVKKTNPSGSGGSSGSDFTYLHTREESSSQTSTCSEAYGIQVKTDPLDPLDPLSTTCDRCGVPLIPANLKPDDIRNWDCPKCKAVKRIREGRGEVAR